MDAHISCAVANLNEDPRNYEMEFKELQMQTKRKDYKQMLVTSQIIKEKKMHQANNL